VRRLWAPRLRGDGVRSRLRRRARQSRRTASEAVDPDAGVGLIDVLDSAAVVVIVVAGVAFLVLVAIPLVLVVIDLVIALVLTALGIGARLLFRRPWTVEAKSEAGERHRWRVVGLRASREHAADVANALAHGTPLPGGEVPSRPPVDGATSASS
jgi:hypothetical protein